MELHLKKRIVGAVVTVLFLVLVMPLVLDGPRSYHLLDTAAPSAPQAPEWLTQEYEQQVREEIQQLASGESAKDLEQPEIQIVDQDTPSPDSVLDDRTQLDEQNLPYAWSLQMGAFEELENALAYRDELRAEGYKAYMTEVDSISRVYVGPELTRAAIEELKKRLQAKPENKDIYILRYQPET